MRMRRPLAAVLASALLLAGPARPDEADPPREPPPPAEVSRAEKVLRDHLARLKGGGARVTPITHPALGRTLPGYTFFSVVFPRYPVARMVPEGLRASSVAVVLDGKVEFLPDVKELERYFKLHLPVAPTDERLKDAARAWLSVSPNLEQDGFYKFQLEDDSTAVMNNKDIHIASGKVVAMGGGNGLISARLIFNKMGKLTEVSQDSKLRPGPRPICQATRLLDPDPIVRRMAEQDLLVMGRAARDYLFEQRSRARPPLQRAIDEVWHRITTAEPAPDGN